MPIVRKLFNPIASYKQKLFQIVKDTKFESNSQHFDKKEYW